MVKIIKGAKDQRGFTLIELIVAMSILAIVIAPTLGLFSATLKNNRYAKEKLVALALAQGRIEELKATDFQNLSAMIEKPDEYVRVEDGTEYSIRTEVEPLNEEDQQDEEEGNQEPKLLKITVTVSWTAGEVTFSTVKGDTKL